MTESNNWSHCHTYSIAWALSARWILLYLWFTESLASDGKSCQGTRVQSRWFLCFFTCSVLTPSCLHSRQRSHKFFGNNVKEKTPTFRIVLNFAKKERESRINVLCLQDRNLEKRILHVLWFCILERYLSQQVDFRLWESDSRWTKIVEKYWSMCHRRLTETPIARTWTPWCDVLNYPQNSWRQKRNWHKGMEAAFVERYTDDWPTKKEKSNASVLVRKCFSSQRDVFANFPLLYLKNLKVIKFSKDDVGSFCAKMRKLHWFVTAKIAAFLRLFSSAMTPKLFFFLLLRELLRNFAPKLRMEAIYYFKKNSCAFK